MAKEYWVLYKVHLFLLGRQKKRKERDLPETEGGPLTP
jgi:hypothetical protein